MVTFILSQSVWELSRMPCVPRRTNMVYVPTCQTSAKFSIVRVNVLMNVPTCQRSANYSIGLPRCQRGANFSNSPAKNRTNFSTIFQNNFSIMLNICKFQGNLCNFKKLILRKKEFKFWHLQNFIKEESPKFLRQFPMEHVGLTKQLFSQCEMELNIFFYLPIFIRFV